MEFKENSEFHLLKTRWKKNLWKILTMEHRKNGENECNASWIAEGKKTVIVCFTCNKFLAHFPMCLKHNS